MKKRQLIAFFFLIFLIPLSMWAQNAYLDAQKFLLVKNEYKDAFAKLATPAFRERISQQELMVLENVILFLNNPFSDSIDARLLQVGEFEKSIRFRSATTPQYPYAENTLRTVDDKSNLSLFSMPIDRSMIPSKMADATAQFLVKRSRDEMMGVFFERFKDKLAEEPLLHALLPATNRLMNFQNSAASTPSLGRSWVNVFESDLRNVLFNFEGFLREQHPQLLKQTEGQLFSMSLQTVRLLSEKHAAPQVLSYFDEKEGKEATEMGRNIRLVNLLSKNLLAHPRSDDWVHRDSFQVLGTEGGTLFWGLMYQRNRALFKRMNMQLTLDNVPQLLTMTDEFLHYGEKLKTLSLKDALMPTHDGTTLQQLKAGKTLEETTAGTDRVDVFLDKAQTLFQMIELGFKAKYYLENNPYKYYTTDMYVKKMSLPRNTLSTFKLMKNRQYGIALLGTAELLEQILPADALNDKSKKALKQYIFYANFMTDIITADNASMSQVVERYAMPSGSYRSKRAAHFSLDVNAFPGFFVGYEGTRTDTTRKGSGVHGIAAPIGLSFSFGKGKDKPTHAFSLFMPMLDIGAAFSYRWKQGTGGGLPEKFKLSQIFAPGLYAVWGVKGAPLSIMGGFQFTPHLRQVVDYKNVVSETNSARFSLTVGMDLPVFGLYRK